MQETSHTSPKDDNSLKGQEFLEGNILGDKTCEGDNISLTSQISPKHNHAKSLDLGDKEDKRDKFHILSEKRTSLTHIEEVDE